MYAGVNKGGGPGGKEFHSKDASMTLSMHASWGWRQGHGCEGGLLARGGYGGWPRGVGEGKGLGAGLEGAMLGGQEDNT